MQLSELLIVGNKGPGIVQGLSCSAASASGRCITLCLKHPCLSILDLPEGCWVCPCCSQPNVLPVSALSFAQMWTEW